MTKRETFWTDARVATLTASWNAGHSAREIATALTVPGEKPVTRNMIVSKVHRLGLPMHQPINTWRGHPRQERRKG